MGPISRQGVMELHSVGRAKSDI